MNGGALIDEAASPAPRIRRSMALKWAAAADAGSSGRGVYLECCQKVEVPQFNWIRLVTTAHYGDRFLIDRRLAIDRFGAVRLSTATATETRGSDENNENKRKRKTRQ